MSPTPYLELEGIAAHLGERRVFNNLTLQLNLGEHTVVLGPNGAGKSALVKLISREMYPVVQSGSHLRLFGDRTVNLWQLRQRIGLVSSDLERLYNPWVCAKDVVLSGCFGSVGIGRSQNPTPAMDQRVAELMQQLDLLELARERFGQLSEGQRRRLLIARALVHKPDVLVLDEPTNALDLKARHQLLELMRQLSSSGTTLLLVTHQIEAVIPEIQRCVMLKAGELMADGPCHQVLTSAKLSNLFETPLQLLEANGYRQVLPGQQ